MEKENNQNPLMTFGEHLEVFRKMLFRIIGITLCLAIVIFCAKDTTFQLLLAPGDSHFVTYRVIEQLAACVGWNFRFEPYSIQLINTELASQFMTHVSTSVYLALLLVSPYILIELYRYIAPALYENERRYSVSVTIAIYLLFILGVLMSYFVLFPFAFSKHESFHYLSKKMLKYQLVKLKNLYFYQVLIRLQRFHEVLPF